MTKVETCCLCGRAVNRSGNYATSTLEGQSHATRHHLVAKRLRPLLDGTELGTVLTAPVFCYKCGEVVLHNPPLTPSDLAVFAALIRARRIDQLPEDVRVTAVIELFHEAIALGLRLLAEKAAE